MFSGIGGVAFHIKVAVRRKLILILCGYAFLVGLAILGSNSSEVQLATQPQRTLHGHEFPIRALAFSPDGTTLVSGGGRFLENSGELICWSVATGEIRWTISTQGGRRLDQGNSSNVLKGPCQNMAQIQYVGFSHDGKILASAGYDGSVYLWDSKTGQMKANLIGHPDQVCALAFSMDDRILASACGEDSVRLWDVDTGNERAVFKAPSGWVGGLAYSKEGPLLATREPSSPDVKVWSWRYHPDEPALRQMAALLTGPKSGTACMALSPENKLLAAGCMDGGLMVWDWAHAGLPPQRFQLGHNPITTLVFSPTARILGAGSLDGQARLCDLHSNHVLNFLLGHAHAIHAMAFSPDGKLLATGGGDKAIILWKIDAGFLGE